MKRTLLALLLLATLSASAQPSLKAIQDTVDKQVTLKTGARSITAQGLGKTLKTVIAWLYERDSLLCSLHQSKPPEPAPTLQQVIGSGSSYSGGQYIEMVSQTENSSVPYQSTLYLGADEYAGLLHSNTSGSASVNTALYAGNDNATMSASLDTGNGYSRTHAITLDANRSSLKPIELYTSDSLGAVYRGNYRAKYTARTLADWGNVKDTLGQALANMLAVTLRQAGNGLSVAGSSTVKLGGAITENTTLDATSGSSGFSMYRTSKENATANLAYTIRENFGPSTAAAAGPYSLVVAKQNHADSVTFRVINSGSAANPVVALSMMKYNRRGGAVLNIGGSSATVPAAFTTVSDSLGKYTTINQTPYRVTVEGASGFKGIEYSGDYSTAYGDRSLPDWAAVRNLALPRSMTLPANDVNSLSSSSGYRIFVNLAENSQLEVQSDLLVGSHVTVTADASGAIYPAVLYINSDINSGLEVYWPEQGYNGVMGASFSVAVNPGAVINIYKPIPGKLFITGLTTP